MNRLTIENSSTSPKWPKLTLLTIPGETRNAIYKIVLGLPSNKVLLTPTPQVSSDDDSETSRVADASAVGLLLVNKQINSEASVLLYSKTKFIIGNVATHDSWYPTTQAFNIFTKTVSADHLACITHITLRLFMRRPAWDQWMTKSIIKHLASIKFIELSFNGFPPDPFAVELPQPPTSTAKDVADVVWSLVHGLQGNHNFEQLTMRNYGWGATWICICTFLYYMMQYSPELGCDDREGDQWLEYTIYRKAVTQEK